MSSAAIFHLKNRSLLTCPWSEFTLSAKEASKMVGLTEPSELSDTKFQNLM